MKITTRFGMLAAVAALIISPIAIQAQDKAAQASGDWPGITWSPAGDPGTGDQVNIGNAYEVDYVGPGLTRVGRLHVGSTFDGSGNTFTPNGTLTVSAGTLETAGNGSIAIQVGFSDNSTGVLNVTGGLLLADGGGWLTVGSGENSMGTVNLSGGTIETATNHVTLGSAEGSTGILNMTGGTLTVANIFFAGRTNTNNNHGEFNQSAGATTIGGPLRIGNATAAGHLNTGTVLLTGGTTTVGENILIGNTSSGVLGEGTLTVGPAAGLSTTGTDSTLIIGGNGELIFQLGTNASFNSINLTSTNTGVALSFNPDSLITIDGTALQYTANYGPIELVTFNSGRGPTSSSLDNLDVSFVGFDPQFTSVQIEWTNTALLLYAIPEPSTAVLLLGAMLFGGRMLLRRRQPSC